MLTLLWIFTRFTAKKNQFETKKSTINILHLNVHVADIVCNWNSETWSTQSNLLFIGHGNHGSHGHGGGFGGHGQSTTQTIYIIQPRQPNSSYLPPTNSYLPPRRWEKLRKFVITYWALHFNWWPRVSFRNISSRLPGDRTAQRWKCQWNFIVLLLYKRF